ncbi:hypothetical protein THTE_0611 [Thermogutta terrifontis]|uniref:Uncharacterized protein n=1 Tax=Thermogutta terrifontis TaxID=1331910 RepID=A0A286RB77_9BACT|nr:hypothetical protein THTE_0611 [Thermogutta terrifontis]
MASRSLLEMTRSPNCRTAFAGLGLGKARRLQPGRASGKSENQWRPRIHANFEVFGLVLYGEQQLPS